MSMRLTGKWPTEPSRELYVAVQAHLLLQGSSLTTWCRQNSVRHAWAWQALTGTRKGPLAIALVKQILKDVKGGQS